MNLRNNKWLKRILQRLIKKVTVTDFSVDEEHMSFTLQLKNFWSSTKEVQVFLEIEESQIELYHELNKNRVLIKLPLTYLNKFEDKGKVVLYVNGQKMWITSEAHLDTVSHFIQDGRYFTININKNIIVSNHFKEYAFTDEKLEVHLLETHYNRINLTSKGPLIDMDQHDQIDVVGISGKKIRIVSCELNSEDRHSLVLHDFNIFSIGFWRLFLKVGKKLYPLQLEIREETKMNTFNHQVKITSKQGDMYLQFEPHLFRSNTIAINKAENGWVLVFEDEERLVERKLSFVIEDTRSQTEILKKMDSRSGQLAVRLSNDDLTESFSNKRFFIVEEGSSPLKYQFDLADVQVKGSAKMSKTIINSQKVKLTFYKRKDNSLGFRVIPPRLTKLIKSIDVHSVKGYVASLDKFPDCRAFILLEDRASLEAVKFPVEGKFDIQLNSEQLLELKGKDKTVLDFFVIVQDKYGNIIRKEKIKYELADYKKDNYYDHLVVEDRDKNQHHFLYTTTPFDNLKLETFTIPNDVNIPEDTSEKDPNIWLLGERYNTAQDNGFALFNWLQNNTEIEAYYVIEADSDDYEKIRDNPFVLTFGSKKHYEIAFKAKVLLGTHDLENLLPYKPARGFFHYENTIKIFLQHGVLGRKNVEYHKKYYDLPFGLFIVSSDPEKYDVVVDQLGYEENEVAVTGLARFDNLIQAENPRDILLMPTWRDWINTDEQFLESEYYRAYSGLIQNELLHDLLEQYDVNLNFYPHYRAQDYFAKDLNESYQRIKFIPLGSKTVQQLLIDHALLITDYSSVSFDFTLMNKPVIYYHFDVKRFFRRGILRPIDETFIGRITSSEEELMEMIEERLKQGLDNFEHDISGIIKYQDQHNCERIFNAVSLKVKKKKENV